MNVISEHLVQIKKDTGKCFNCTLLFDIVINCSQPWKNFLQKNIHCFHGSDFTHDSYTTSSHMSHCSAGVLKAHIKMRQMLYQLKKSLRQSEYLLGNVLFKILTIIVHIQRCKKKFKTIRILIRECTV